MGTSLKFTSLVEISACAVFSELTFTFDHCDEDVNLITVKSKLQMNDCSFETEKNKRQVLLYGCNDSVVSLNSCIVTGFKQHICAVESYIQINTCVFDKASSSCIFLQQPCYFGFQKSQILNARLCGVIINFGKCSNTKTRIISFTDSQIVDCLSDGLKITSGQFCGVNLSILVSKSRFV